MEISFPIFVRARDSGEIYRFDSVYEIQREFEQIDIENDEFEAWDGKGLSVQLECQKPIWLKLTPSELPDLDRLFAAVCQFAEAIGIAPGELVGPESAAPVVDKLRAEHEKQKLSRSLVRRLVRRLATKRR